MNDVDFYALAGKLAAARMTVREIDAQPSTAEQAGNLMMAEARRDALSWELRKAAEARVKAENETPIDIIRQELA